MHWWKQLDYFPKLFTVSWGSLGHAWLWLCFRKGFLSFLSKLSHLLPLCPPFQPFPFCSLSLPSFLFSSCSLSLWGDMDKRPWLWRCQKQAGWEKTWQRAQRRGWGGREEGREGRGEKHGHHGPRTILFKHLCFVVLSPCGQVRDQAAGKSQKLRHQKCSQIAGGEHCHLCYHAIKTILEVP